MSNELERILKGMVVDNTGTVLELAWKDCGKPGKTPEFPIFLPRFEESTSGTRV
jgi:hypothetical protein